MRHYGNIATFILVLFSTSMLFAQNRYKLIDPEVSFFSSAPVEDIEAINETALGVIDFDARKFSIRVKIKDFEFESSLMREHFNENYMESEKFPHGIFKGEIVGDYDLSKDGEYAVVAKGNLTIHGVAKAVEHKVKVTVDKSEISIFSKFDVALKDHDIEIPTLLFKKISEIIQVEIASGLEEVTSK